MGIEEGQVDSGSDISDAQIEAIESGGQQSHDIPMRAQETPAAQSAQQYTLKVNGKDIQAPIEKVLQWAQLGYDYPQKAKEMNQWKSKFEEVTQKEKTLGEIEKKWSPYKEIDDYASQNPDWWQQVQSSYQQKIAGAQTNPEIQALRQELAELKSFRDEIKSEKQTLKTQEEDKILTSESESIRKAFPNLDWDSPDEGGNSLEMRILKHAMEIGLDGSKQGHFRAAFRDYYHDQLVNRAREEGKELVTKETQKRTKLGILGETSKPTKGLTVAKNLKDKSYNDLMQEALDELQSGG